MELCPSVSVLRMLGVPGLLPVHWCVGPGPLPSGEWNHVQGQLCSQSELQFPPITLGDSPRSTSRSDLGSFQMTTSALGVRDFCVLSLTVASLFVQSSVSPRNKPC